MKPIIFSTDMIRAILDGKKTMTRRIIKPQPEQSPNAECDIKWGFQYYNKAHLEDVISRCPFGQVGDRLWVRETFSLRNDGQQVMHKEGYLEIIKALEIPDLNIKWKPSIHMPRWASRITLEITEVRVGRQLDITLQDAIAEGFGGEREFNETFLRLNPNLREENPWVWVISFKQLPNGT